MATEGVEQDLELTPTQEPLTKQDLCDLREDLLAAMSTMVATLLQPVQQSINEVRHDLKETSRIAENASEMALTLQEERSREAVLKMARMKGSLLYNDQKILVLLDLSSETLDKRRKLKPVISKLNEARIRFRWSPVSDIHIYKNGLQYQASDPVTGRALLAALGIKLTRKEEEDLLLP
ncbi:UNVERIFIED_CONTAM: hypothetical protein K2H54_036445 [Gekko kuhli]